MALKLYFHPLASFCHKALIALYENRIPFEPIIVDQQRSADKYTSEPRSVVTLIERAGGDTNFFIKNNSLPSPVIVSQWLLESTARHSSIDTNSYNASPPN